MTTHLDRLLIVFPIAGKRAGGASLQELIEVAPGREVENLIPLDLDQVAQYAGQFNLGLIAERDQIQAQLQAQLSSTLEDLATANQEKTTALAEKDAALSEKDAALAQVDSLQAQIEALQAQLDAIQNPPGPDLSTIEGVKQYLAAKRYDREVMGFTVGEQFISTNRDELAHWFARFFDAFNHLNGVPSAGGGVYPYKPRGGSQVALLTAQQAVRAYQCLAWYVNTCIATEGQLIQQIDDGSLSLADAIVVIDSEQTWPQRQFTWVPE